MRSLILCFAIAASASLGACATGSESRVTVADAPHASDGPMLAGRARARADANTAVGRSTSGY